MVKVNSITVHPENIEMRVDDWYYGAWASVSPSFASNPKVKWYSTNTSVASVNEASGYIYSKAVGTAKICAVAVDGSGVKGCLTVVVTNHPVYVSEVHLDRKEMNMQKGERKNLWASIYPSNASDKSLYWISTDTDVVTVDNGVVQAKGKGCAWVRAVAQDGRGAMDCCYVTVTENILVSSIDIVPSTITLTQGKSDCPVVKYYPSNATYKCVEWYSSDRNIASVNTISGMIYAHSVGTAVITAKSQDGSGVTGQCTVTVKPRVYVDSITIEKKKYTIGIGKKFTIPAKICPEEAINKNVEWDCTDLRIAVVNTLSGEVTGKKAGTVTITAKATDGSGIMDCCEVVVSAATPTPVEDTGKDKNPTQNPDNYHADPVDVYSGAHVITNTLMTLYGGQGLKLTANYDSSRLSGGVFGRGWYHNYEKHLEMMGCEMRVYTNPSVYTRYVSNDDCTVYTCQSPSKKGYVLTVDCLNTYPYVLDCNKQSTEYYDSEGRLAKVVDHKGFETIISYSDTAITITDSVTGESINLNKDDTGKVTCVRDSGTREVHLTYNCDMLVGIKDPREKSIAYTYNEKGQVLTGTDSENTCFFTNTYDESDRVATQRDGVAGSAATIFCYDNNGTRTVTDRNGKRIVRVYDENGLLKSYTDANGNTKTYEYDSSYNVIKETDANGNSIIKEYDFNNRPTKITDKNGNKTCITYDSKGNVTKICYPEVNGVTPEETFTYNSRNQLTAHTDLRGTTTIYSYDNAAMPATKKVGSKNAVVYSYHNGRLASETDAKGNTTHYGYDTIGLMTSKTDANNNVTRFEYDLCGNLLKTIHPDGSFVSNTYDGNHQKISSTDANGNKTDYIYNGNMKLEKILLPDGNNISYGYDGEDRETRVVDQAGNQTTTQYDDGGRVVSKRFADGGVVKYEYDNVGNVVKETNPKGAVTLRTYDAKGNVLSVEDNEGNITRYQYNAMSKVIKAVNAVSGATVYEYSAAGDLLSETDALGNKKSYTYDAFGNKATATDAKGNVTQYAYDDNNNLLTVRDAMGNTTTYTYNCLNQVEMVKDARNNIVRYGYDALGRRISVTDAKNNVFTTEYDSNGNVVKTCDAKGNVITQTEYNCLDLPKVVTQASGNVLTYAYNELGKVKTITDSDNKCSEYTYNSRGMNISVRDTANGTSNAVYDTLGNITRLSGPLGAATNYSYDDMGRLISETTSSGGVVQYSYNELNVKKQLTNARGNKRRFFYDAAGRISGCVSREDSVSYVCDANGNVVTVSDKNGTVKREYDALNRVTKYTDTYGKTICYEYDEAGNLAKLIYPDNTSVTYSYDENNNLTSVTDWAGRVTSYTYDANNKVIGVVKPDGSVVTTVYDNNHRITSTVEKTASGTVITGFEYTYDSLSRIVEEKNLANNTYVCYNYDNLNRVVSRAVTSGCDKLISIENFSYDAAGNIIDAPNSCFSYDNNNRLIAFQNEDVEYDLDGNMKHLAIDGEVKCFEYDSANRLIKATGHTYTYNAEDIRIRNLCCDEDTVYTYNTNCKLNQLLVKTTNGVVTKYVYGLGLIGEEKCGEFKTYHFDYRGSTIAVTDTSGNVTDTFEYNAYGKIVSRTGNSDIIFCYNGRDGVVTEKNGLIYMRARYYSPDIRRFVNADIIRGAISDSTSLNRYAYVNGNPASLVDPLGLSADGRGQYGSVEYNGNIYPIYVPSLKTGVTIGPKWETVNEIVVNDFSFDKLKFFLGIEFDDVNGLANGSNPATKYMSNEQLAAASVAGIVHGVFNSFFDSLNSTFVTFVFQETGEKRRVIIKAGSTENIKFMTEYADGNQHSKLLSNTSAMGYYWNEAENLYETLSGEKADPNKMYDVVFTLDKERIKSRYSSYLWIDAKGRIMETAMLYKNDKLELGTRNPLFPLTFDSLIELPINGSSPVSDEYQKLFDKAIVGN